MGNDGHVGTIPKTTSASNVDPPLTPSTTHEAVLTDLPTEIRLLERVYYHCA